MSHARGKDTHLPPLGTRAMFELTVVAAIGFAVFVSVDKFEFMEGLLFFTAVGALSSAAVVFSQIALLREGRRSFPAVVVSAVFAFATAAIFNGFFAVAEFGWELDASSVLVVGAVSLYGGVVIFAVMSLCLWWLHRCGWRCVRQRESRRIAGEPPMPTQS